MIKGIPSKTNIWRDVWEIIRQEALNERSIWKGSAEAQFEYLKHWKWTKKNWFPSFYMILNGWQERWYYGVAVRRKANIRHQDYWATDWSLRDFGRWRKTFRLFPVSWHGKGCSVFFRYVKSIMFGFLLPLISFTAECLLLVDA